VIADPLEFEDLARIIGARADAVAELGTQLGARLDATLWKGPVADRFRGNAADLTRLLSMDADLLRAVSDDLRRLADELQSALDDLRAIEQAVRGWLAANPPGLSPIPPPWPPADLPATGDPRWRQVQAAFSAAGIHLAVVPIHTVVPGAAPPAPAPLSLGAVGPPDAAMTASVLGMPVTPAEKWIIDHEDASYSTSAYNPVPVPGMGHAFGLGQLTETIRRRYLGADYNTTDQVKQLAAMRAYIHDRYGTAEKAVEHWQAHNWY
jgi:hypothetical protein